MKAKFEDLYRARENALEKEAALLDVEDDRDLADGLAQEIQALQSETPSTQSFRLQVIASVLPKVQVGAESLLIQVLNHEDRHVRLAAYRAATEMGKLRYPQLVLAVERAMESDLTGPWLREVPSLLLSSLGPEDEPPLDVLLRFVDHKDADAAAEGLCALFELRVPGARGLFESLALDERPLSPMGTAGLSLYDANDATLGELAQHLLSVMAVQDTLDGPGSGHA